MKEDNDEEHIECGPNVDGPAHCAEAEWTLGEATTIHHAGDEEWNINPETDCACAVEEYVERSVRAK